MVSKRRTLSSTAKRETATAGRARSTVAKVRANKAFMDGVHEALEARRRGQSGVTLTEIKRRMARKTR